MEEARNIIGEHIQRKARIITKVTVQRAEEARIMSVHVQAAKREVSSFRERDRERGVTEMTKKSI